MSPATACHQPRQCSLRSEFGTAILLQSANWIVLGRPSNSQELSGRWSNKESALPFSRFFKGITARGKGLSTTHAVFTWNLNLYNGLRFVQRENLRAKKSQRISPQMTVPDRPAPIYLEHDQLFGYLDYLSNSNLQRDDTVKKTKTSGQRHNRTIEQKQGNNRETRVHGENAKQKHTSDNLVIDKSSCSNNGNFHPGRASQLPVR